MLQRAIASRFVVRLPPVRTPETVSTYLRDVTGDPSAELLYWSEEMNELVDQDGLRHSATEILAPEQRFTSWILGSDGTRVALLTAGPDLGRDTATLDSLGRVLSIIAENARLNLDLRMRLAELTATRTAEKLALEQAREEFHRNLHDGLQQTIATVRMDLDGLHDVLPDGHGDAIVSELEAKLAFALEQVHSLKKGTDPPELKFGLKPAVERTVAQLRLTADCDITAADLGILTVPVYYLVREALTNVHKHARATHTDVRVNADAHTIAVTVTDNGVGGAAESGLRGIVGMRKRVEELGGELRLTSPVTVGTTLTVSIPRMGSRV
jgi:signal transduction histidine kinase